MRILLAVIDDLYTFVLRIALFPFERSPKKQGVPVPAVHKVALEAEGESHKKAEDSALLHAETKVPEDETPETASVTFKRVEEILDRVAPATPTEEAKTSPQASNTGTVATPPEKNTIMYIRSGEVKLFKKPTIEFDTVISSLGYGDMVMLFEKRGRWAHVGYGEIQGWVLREDLADTPHAVYPEFMLGSENAADAQNTIRVRATIRDQFAGALAALPLQAGEYVVYRLIRRGLEIMWPNDRPRVPGIWHALLRGVPGIRIGTTPKTGALMEYMMSEEMGHIAYIESVLPDETIRIAETNFPDNGIYNERVLTREEWRELRPVFIQVM